MSKEFFTQFKQEKNTLTIAIDDGRLGDCIMRLVGFYTLARIKEIQLKIYVRPELLELSKQLFSDHLILIETRETPDYTFTSKGLLNIIFALNPKTKIVAPYHMIEQWNLKKKTLKSSLKKLLIKALCKSGRFCTLRQEDKDYYLGFAEARTLYEFRDITYERFKTELNNVLPLLRERIQSSIRSEDGSNFHTNELLVLPSGTSFQKISPDWAAANLREGLFAFFLNDQNIENYKKLGLKTVSFSSPSELLVLSAKSTWCITTDSFPSHLLQLLTDNLTICLTHERGVRTVLPGFKGVEVESVVMCSPCAGVRTRGLNCLAGVTYCNTWKEQRYTDKILKSIKS